MKRLIGFLFAFSLTLTFVGTAFASSNNTDGKVNAVGVPDNKVVLTGNNPAFSQVDLDNNFTNYAEDGATFDVMSNSQLTTVSKPLANVVGIVLNQADNTPIANAVITAQGLMTVDVQSGSDGRFQIINMPNGEYNWLVAATGFGKGEFLHYTVDSSDGATIFTFYLNEGKETYIDHNAFFNDGDQKIAEETLINNASFSASMTSSTMTAPPTLHPYIRVLQTSGAVTSIGRQQYLYTVLSSELYSQSWYMDRGLTTAQVSNLYVAQAMVANTFVEYAINVYSNHGSTADVCSTSCCQVYDSTKVTQVAINTVAGLFENVGGTSYCPLILYKQSSTTYSYIYGAFGSSCSGQGTVTVPGQPALIAKPCTDLVAGAGGNRQGMCQMGAALRAKNGDSYSGIINYYFTNCSIVNCPIA